MKKYIINLALLTIVFAAGSMYGIVIHKNQCFSYEATKIVYYRMHKFLKIPGPWSIGIYVGSTPFDLSAPEDISNPVLTGKDVSDIDASLVADPFMVFKDGKYSMFFEVLNRETNQGDIGYAESTDGMHWEYRRIIIDETFHMSYPSIFEWNDDYYLIPETHEDLSVRLYKAISFPEQWEYIGNLLTGYHYVDPTIFRHNEKWWLFVSTPNDDILNLYHSSELLGEWKPHPKNPIVKFDKNIARPGGKVFTYNGCLYRLAQDDDPYYGIQVFAFEITELSEKSYAEKIASEKPVVNMTGKGWNAAGMHHVDLLKIGDKWIAAVDGRKK